MCSPPIDLRIYSLCSPVRFYNCPHPKTTIETYRMYHLKMSIYLEYCEKHPTFPFFMPSLDAHKPGREAPHTFFKAKMQCMRHYTPFYASIFAIGILNFLIHIIICSFSSLCRLDSPSALRPFSFSHDYHKHCDYDHRKQTHRCCGIRNCWSQFCLAASQVSSFPF